MVTPISAELAVQVYKKKNYLPFLRFQNFKLEPPKNFKINFSEKLPKVHSNSYTLQ